MITGQHRRKGIVPSSPVTHAMPVKLVVDRFAHHHLRCMMEVPWDLSGEQGAASGWNIEAMAGTLDLARGFVAQRHAIMGAGQ
jgi:hypothetical protein